MKKSGQQEILIFGPSGAKDVARTVCSSQFTPVDLPLVTKLYW